MSRASRKQPAPASRATNDKATFDSFNNVLARVGMGTQNLNSGSRYNFSFISRDYQQLSNIYRTSWIAKQVIDLPAQDMTRAGIEINTPGLDPEQVEDIQATFEEFEIWARFSDQIKWSRLYGGAVAVIMIDGQDLTTPLNLDSIDVGQFKGLYVLDRWQITPSLVLNQDMGPDIGKPLYYQVNQGPQAFSNKKIHYSRLIVIEGGDLPFQESIREQGWGLSVIEPLWDRLVAFDSTTEGAAQLVYKAHLRTVSVEGLRSVIAAGGAPLEGVMKNFEFIRAMQTNEGLTVIDSADTFAAHSYSFSGLSDMLLNFGQQLAGASGIPLVRLFGQSPAGLSATGDADIRNYYDSIAQLQDRKLRKGIGLLIDIMCRSVLGIPAPKGTRFEFNPLWQMSDNERADIAVKLTQTIIAAEEAGVIDRATALKELSQSSDTTGVWTNITSEMIEEAENEPPMLGEYNGEETTAGENQEDPAGIREELN